jgi:cobalt-zinc-cadmium efflux system membrane fusion protein
MRHRLIGFTLILVMAGCSKPQPAPEKTMAASAPTESGEIRLPPESPQLKRLRVEKVKAEDVPLEEVTVPGKIEAKPTFVSRLAVPVAGRVKQVMVSLGDTVTQGQPVLVLDSPDIGAVLSTYRQAQAKLSQAKSAEAKADADLNRIKDLFNNRAAAQKDVLAAETILTQTKSDVAQAEASLEESKKRLQLFGLRPDQPSQDILVRAPVSGKVLDISITAGEYRNDTSAPVMTIADLSTVYITSDVPENQIRFIRLEEPIEISLIAYPGETFHGRVKRIGDTVDPQTRTIKVRAELQNPDGRLRPEMFGEIRLKRGFREVPVVPAGAIVQGDQKNIIYRQKSEGVFEIVEVTFGKRDGDMVPILSGIQAGDEIVVDGTMLLRNY